MNRQENRIAKLEEKKPKEKAGPVSSLQLARATMSLFAEAEGSKDPAVISLAAAVAALLGLDKYGPPE